MSYTAPSWANGTTPAINATNLQALSDAVAGMQCYPQVTVAEARNALGLGNSAGALPIANGGTGSTTAATARSNLGITPANIGALSTSGGTVSGSVTVSGDLTVSGTIHSTIAAATADRLTTARNLKVNLGSINAQAFNGSADATSIGVSGILPVLQGGTGVSTIDALLAALGYGTVTTEQLADDIYITRFGRFRKLELHSVQISSRTIVTLSSGDIPVFPYSPTQHSDYVPSYGTGCAYINNALYSGSLRINSDNYGVSFIDNIHGTISSGSVMGVVIYIAA